jgi:hypothetical protein
MGTTNYSIPTIDSANLVSDGPDDINAALEAVDGLFDARDALNGVSSPAKVRSGKSIISAAETRTNVAFGLLTTPDRVQNVVLATDGLIEVWYQATWKDTSNGGQVRIFLGTNEVKVATPLAPGLVGTSTPPTTATNKYRPLTSYAGGLISYGDATTSDYADDVTTGQIIGAFGDTLPVVGGPCYIFASAGTYDVSIQFNSGAGTLTVKNRKLWVRAVSF